MNKKDEQKEFDGIVDDLSKRKLDYNYSELQRIKDRAHQIVAFFLVIMSIIASSLTVSNILHKLLVNHFMMGVLFTGFGLAVLTMSICFYIMTRKDKNLIIDPKSLYYLYNNSTIDEVKEVLRDTVFQMLEYMDKRNLELHYKMGRIYCLSVVSLVIIFIPMIWLIFTQ